MTATATPLQPTSSADQPLLSVRDLRVTFARQGETPFRAVDGVSFDVRPGQTVGLVGESGCGKSVTSLAIMGLLPKRGNTVEGAASFEGTNLLELGEREMRDRRGRDIAMIFQDPLSSLNPVVAVGLQVTEVLERHRGMSRRAARPLARDLLQRVGIPDPDRRLKDYPHQMSGGMRQRALIAMALACAPRLLIADEPTTALDVTIQAQILALLKELVQETGTALVMITHDLGVVAGLCDEVNVLYAGRIVERGGATSCSPTRATPTPTASSARSHASTRPAASGSRRSPARSPTTCRGTTPARSPRGAPNAIDACTSTRPGPRGVPTRALRCHNPVR